MKTYNKLVHDNVTDILKDQGYDKLQGKKLKGKKYKAELYSLFFHEYKETLRKDKPQQLQVHYAEMLEVIRTLMMATKTNIKDVDLSDLSSAVPAFLTLILMPLTYSISNGIAVGAIAYVLIRLFTGKYTKKDIVVTVIALLFIFRFIFVNTL